MQDVESLKRRGNDLFAEERYVEARQTYSEALACTKENRCLVATLLSNRSVAAAMLDDFAAALRDAEDVLTLRPEWGRGYVRKAVALIGLDRLDAASEVIDEGRRVDADDAMVRDVAAQIAEMRRGVGREHKRKVDDATPLAEALSQIRAAGVVRPLEVVVVSGFLGAGKTTLLTRLLRQNDGARRLAVLVNDMAEINVDAALLQQSHAFAETTEELVELTNGCVCCTLRGDLIKEATRLLCLQRFDVLVIEATGIGEPMPVAATFLSSDFHGHSLRNYFKIDNMVTVVDGSGFLEKLERGGNLPGRQTDGEDRSISGLLIDQVEFADTIIVNKRDLVSSEAALQHLQALLSRLNPTARCLVASHSDVALTEIFGTGRFSLERARSFDGFQTELVSPHDAEAETYGIGSHVFASPIPFHPIRLHRLLFGRSNGDDNALDPLSPLQPLFRSKGIFYLASALDWKLNWSTAGRTVQFEVGERWLGSMVPEKHWRRDWDRRFADREQKIVLISHAEQLPSLRVALERCLLTEAELRTHEHDWPSLDPSHLWRLDHETSHP